ncbi:MAG: hypothetical protein FWE15_22120, partial [Actinomycetia bacterium]|nr:hypothetical protein [Actinomycetes bacterium]
WMEAGDFGTFYEETLFVLGRRADVLTIRAEGCPPRRYWPSLIEQTAARAAPGSVIAHRTAAVQDVDGRVVVIAETRKNADPAAAADAIRGAVVREHGLVLADVVLTVAGAVPVTTSGKLRRAELGRSYRSAEGLGDARLRSLRAAS